MYYSNRVWARASHGKVEGQWKDYVGVCSTSTVTYLCKPHLLYRPFFFLESAFICSGTCI